jgi:hypothetical protein
MTDESMPLLELLQKRGAGDFLKELAEAVLQRLMEFEAEGLIGAGRWERSDARTTQRNGYRHRALDTRLGTLALRIPKLRHGSYFPAFLEPRKTAERALVAVVQEAWILGISTSRARSTRWSLAATRRSDVDLAVRYNCAGSNPQPWQQPSLFMSPISLCAHHLTEPSLQSTGQDGVDDARR